VECLENIRRQGAFKRDRWLCLMMYILGKGKVYILAFNLQLRLHLASGVALSKCLKSELVVCRSSCSGPVGTSSGALALWSSTRRHVNDVDQQLDFQRTSATNLRHGSGRGNSGNWQRTREQNASRTTRDLGVAARIAFAFSLQLVRYCLFIAANPISGAALYADDSAIRDLDSRQDRFIPRTSR
jgi:hypothetical protein